MYFRLFVPVLAMQVMALAVAVVATVVAATAVAAMAVVATKCVSGGDRLLALAAVSFLEVPFDALHSCTWSPHARLPQDAPCR